MKEERSHIEIPKLPTRLYPTLSTEAIAFAINYHARSDLTQNAVVLLAVIPTFSPGFLNADIKHRYCSYTLVITMYCL